MARGPATKSPPAKVRRHAARDINEINGRRVRLVKVGHPRDRRVEGDLRNSSIVRHPGLDQQRQSR
jgi:hypothetical protein